MIVLTAPAPDERGFLSIPRRRQSIFNRADDVLIPGIAPKRPPRLLCFGEPAFIAFDFQQHKPLETWRPNQQVRHTRVTDLLHVASDGD